MVNLMSNHPSIDTRYRDLMTQAFPDGTEIDAPVGVTPDTWFAALRGYLNLLNISGVAISIGDTHQLGITAHQLSLRHIASQSTVSIAIDAGLILFNHSPIDQNGSRMIESVMAQLIAGEVPISNIKIFGAPATSPSVVGLLHVAHGCVLDFHMHWQQPNQHHHLTVSSAEIQLDQTRHELGQIQTLFRYRSTETPQAIPTPTIIDVHAESDDTGIDLSFIFENQDSPKTPCEDTAQTPPDLSVSTDESPPQTESTYPIPIDVAQTQKLGTPTRRITKSPFTIAFPDHSATDEPPRTESPIHPGD